MQVILKSLFLGSLLGCSAFAQSSKEYAPAAPILVPSPKSKASGSIPIAESEHTKNCPTGFKQIGKQCVQTLTARADIVCATGTVLVDGKCAKYHGKSVVCPAPFEQSKEGCSLSHSAQPEVFCPAGFTMTGKDDCTKLVQLPNRAVCPGGSVAHGDQCVIYVTEAPQLVCATGYRLEGKNCVREDTFDCTPPKKPSVRTSTASYKDKAGPYTQGKKHQTTVEEYVVQSTCKKITTEPANKICLQGVLKGKACSVETFVDAIVRPGQFREESAPARRQCPDGFFESGPGSCVAVETVAPKWVCPSNTIDQGDKCTTFSPPKTICPKGFSLESATDCVKTLFAAPIVEYSVTYSCTGKNCGH